VPLSDASEQTHGVSADEKAMIEKLRQLTIAPGRALLDDIAASFGPLRRPGPPDFWYPDARDVAAKCFDCGLHLIILENRLVQINWGVSSRFRLIFIPAKSIVWFDQQ